MRNYNVAATNESKALTDAIYKYGCITLDQLAYFMPPSTRKKPNYHSIVCNHLISGRLATKLSDNVFCPYVKGEYSQPMIDSIWVMIDLLDDGNTDIPLSEKLEISFKAEYPESLCFIRNSEDTVKTLAIETPSQLSLIPFVQERFYASANVKPGEEVKRKSVEIIIIRDKSLLSEISKIDIKIPHKIALLEGNVTEKPVITYFGNTPKNA